MYINMVSDPDGAGLEDLLTYIAAVDCARFEHRVNINGRRWFEV